MSFKVNTDRIADKLENYKVLMAVFVAIWIKKLYRKYDYNFYEILILLFFILGMQMQMLSLFGALESLTNTGVLRIGANIVLIYAIWATGQFFDKRKILNYFKDLVSYVLGAITFYLVTLGIGILIDLMR